MTAITRAYDWLSEGNEITGKMIAELVDENSGRHDTQIASHERYKGTESGVPILKRVFPISNYSKVNNKLANDFFSDIINTKIGYFAGRPVSYKYTVKDAKGAATLSEDVDAKLDGFLKRNQIADLDSETAKIAAISGMGSRLCYVDLEGAARIINVPPWECIFICDEIGITDAPYAIRYYRVEKGDKKFTKAEFYDDVKVSYWIREDTEHSSLKDTAFVMDPDEGLNPIAHMMSGCPLICFPNNEELLGDCDKVLSLIDGYDKTLSDVNSEIEQFRLAYLAFYGSIPNEDTLNKLRQTGVVGFPQTEDRMEYITKNLNDIIIENHLNRLDENIIYLSQSVRFTDESFGQASGVAMKFKLFSLESKCMTAERKFTKALYHQFSVLSGYFQKRGVSYDPWDLEFVFTRNFPLNLLDEATSLQALRGNVSDHTAFGQMSFIDDPDKEIELMKAEQEEYVKAEQEINEALGITPDQNQEQPNNKEETNAKKEE